MRPEALGLAVGVVADAVLADPRRAHPVAAFGAAAAAVERRVWADRRARGAGYAAAVVGAAVGLGRTAAAVAARRPGVRLALTAVASWTVLGGTTLRREAVALADALERGDLAAARARLPRLCGRDPAALDGPGLARATVESVAENTADAVVAPLLWGAAAGLPGLLGYRAANTLDAMVGYRSPRYARFGWAAARLDDAANLAPSRLTALLTAACAPLVGGSAGGAYRTWRRDGGAHPSPNAGQCEAAFAGALGVRLGGRTVYAGRVEDRPVLGTGPAAPTPGDIRRAARLSGAVGLAAAGLAVAAAARPAAHLAAGQAARSGWAPSGCARSGGAP
jgi:adenosylcobinamide-phosphate synthase